MYSQIMGMRTNWRGETQKIETTAGLVYGKRIDENEYQVRLNDVTKIDTDMEIMIDGVKFMASYIELGNPGLPHLAVPLENLNSVD